jgi:hypothetical protein
VETEYDGIEQLADNSRANQSIIIDNGKYMSVVVILAVLCGAAAIFAWRASEKADRSEERADLLQYYVMELDGKVMQAGIIKPEESFAAKSSEAEK